jgi:hypothetical protein
VSSFQQQPQQQQQTRIKQQQPQQWALDEESPQLRSGEPAAHRQSNTQQHTHRPLLLASAVPLLAAAGGVLGSGFSVEGPWSVAQALGALAAIIAVHEAGHFAAARLQGIHVTEFSIGFGPRLWSRTVCVLEGYWFVWRDGCGTSDCLRRKGAFFHWLMAAHITHTTP